jgi:hypothetical protein
MVETMDAVLFEKFTHLVAENDRLQDALASMKRQRDRLLGALEADPAYQNKENDHWQFLARQHAGASNDAQASARQANEAVIKLRSAIKDALSLKQGVFSSASLILEEVLKETISFADEDEFENYSDEE